MKEMPHFILYTELNILCMAWKHKEGYKKGENGNNGWSEGMRELVWAEYEQSILIYMHES